ncbi:MAG: arsenic resistance N-acetyltransferase ArsN2 [Steroidobacteraceae bacterium]
MSIRIERAKAADGAAIRSLLEHFALPVADLASAPLGFWVARREQPHIVGAVGLERYGTAGLLRSLVVSSTEQRRGLGGELVATLESDARATEVELLVLLTQTAESFFERIGYTAIDRAYVPFEIQQSAEFGSLCPASAVCMMKSVMSQP